MTKTSKIALLIIIVVIIIGGIWYMVSRRPAEEEEEIIKVGAILPLSGPVSIFGNWIREGIDMALEDINDSRISVVYEDSKLDAKEGISAFNKLVDIDNAKIIISAMSSVSVPLIPLAKEKEILLFLQDVTYPNITVGNPLVIRHFIQSDREASILAEYALDELKIKKIGILYVNDEAGVGAKEAFKKIFEEKGGEILALESYGARDTDMKTQILKIKNQNVEGIYLFGNGPSWAQALKQIKELGFEGKILTNTAMFIKNFREIAGNSIEGVYFTYPYADKSKTSVKRFINLYKEKYDREPEIEAYYAWDILHVLVDSLKKNNWELKNIEKVILEMKEFNGAFGKTTITPEGDFLTSIGIGVIEEGEIKEVSVVK